MEKFKNILNKDINGKYISPQDEVFDEIHRSNMSKLDENGNPIYREDGKVVKGLNYFKPDIEKIFTK